MAQTVSEFILGLLTQFLGGAGVPDWVTKMGYDFGVKQLGLKNDIFLNTAFGGNLSGFGTSQWQRQQDNLQAAATLQKAFTQSTFINNVYTPLAKTTYSYDQFLADRGLTAKEDPKNKELYDTYTQLTARGMADNWFVDAGTGIIDPMGIKAASQYMGITYNNLSNNAVRQGNRAGAANAFEFTSALINDYAKNFNSKEYGNMTIGEVTKLTAALSKDSRFASEVISSRDPAALAKDFNKKVKEYAEALEPMKDIFGDDMDKMLKSLEQITGQNVANMGASQVKRLATQINNAVMSGDTTIQQIGALSASFASALSQMDVSSMVRSQANQFAMSAIAGIGDASPYGMSREDYVNRRSKRVIRAGASTGGKFMQSAYALYLHKTGKQDSDETFEAWRSAVSDGEGGLDQKRMLSLAGVSSDIEANNQAALLGKTMETVRANGRGLQSALAQQMDKRRSAFANQLANTYGFKRSDINRAVGLIEENGLLTMSTDDLETWMDKNKVSDVQRQIISFARNGDTKTAEAYKEAATGAYTEKKRAERDKAINARKDKWNAFSKNLSTGVIRDLATVVTEWMDKGGNWEAAKEVFKNHTARVLFDGNEDADMMALTKAGGLLVSGKTEDELADMRLLHGLMSYHNSADSAGNKAYNDAFKRLQEARTKEDAKIAAEDMLLYSQVSEAAVTAAYGDNSEAKRELAKEAKNGKSAVFDKLKKDIKDSTLNTYLASGDNEGAFQAWRTKNGYGDKEVTAEEFLRYYNQTKAEGTLKGKAFVELEQAALGMQDKMKEAGISVGGGLTDILGLDPKHIVGLIEKVFAGTKAIKVEVDGTVTTKSEK